MFNALDEFLNKMQKAYRRFAIYLHNLLEYGTLATLPPALEDPDAFPTEVDEWLVYFLQAKPCFQGGDVYTMALIETSIPLGKILKAWGEWFKETCFGMLEATIQFLILVAT